MKSNILTISTFLAAIAAIVLVPMSATAAVMAFTAPGVLSVFVADYGRSIRPVMVPAQVVPFHAAQPAPVGLTEAA